jgi:hypothetical protein
MRQKKRELKATSAMLLCLVSATWRVNPIKLSRLGAFRDHLGRLKDCQIVLPSQDQLTSNVARAENIRSLTVNSLVPEYISDLTQYIKQWHCDPPRRDSLTFFYDEHSQDYWRGIMASSTDNLMNDFIEKYFLLNGQIPKDVEPRVFDPSFVMRCASEYLVQLASRNLSKIALHLNDMVICVVSVMRTSKSI